jgi:phospholipid/cholesterol/gamma-HCH transport system permease protein
MAVSEELLALEVLSIDTYAFLVLPRVVALGLIGPLLTIFVNGVALVGGGLIARAQLDVSFDHYWLTATEALRTTGEFVPLPKDLYVGLFKAFVFGVTIAVVACSCGMRARGGAKGVGEATRRSVRNAFVLIIIFNYIVTSLFYR